MTGKKSEALVSGNNTNQRSKSAITATMTGLRPLIATAAVLWLRSAISPLKQTGEVIFLVKCVFVEYWLILLAVFGAVD